MRVPLPARCAFVAIATGVVLLAGCSGGASRLSSTPVLPQTSSRALMPSPSVALSRRISIPSQWASYPSWRSPGAITPEIYVLDLDENAVKIYTGTGSHGLTGTLSGLSGPQGLAVDSSGNLYVANTAAQNVLVYQPGQTKPSLRLSDTGNFPVAVAVLLTGEVVVANLCSGSGSQCVGNGSIFGYKKGATKHSVTYGNANILSPFFVTSDAADHVYADGFSTEVSGRPIICEYETGHSPCTNLQIPFNYPGGIQIDKTGDLALLDQAGSGGSTLSVYAPGTTTPESSFKLCTNKAANDPCDVIGFALTASNKGIWDAYYASEINPVVFAKESQEFKYPGGGKSVWTILVGGTVGAVAVAPRSKP
jgi:hypothetical protein